MDQRKDYFPLAFCIVLVAAGCSALIFGHRQAAPMSADELRAVTDPCVATRVKAYLENSLARTNDLDALFGVLNHNEFADIQTHCKRVDAMVHAVATQAAAIGASPAIQKEMR